ncbi:predicted protein [Nematostella vectensis]|uniref:G-protein coupled receptors family 3 profile domain-containing protein n=2 Tax=Nematostella vectensis TaxID=45351 RepID=A7S379_NEMVE|nr:predicted protein [Nematostella vectensis]|eukprot:XP_001633904.1 predicted protein [Nematostella vectensis]
MSRPVDLAVFLVCIVCLVVAVKTLPNITISCLVNVGENDEDGFRRSLQLARQLVRNNTQFSQLTGNFSIHLQINDLPTKVSSAIYVAGEIARTEPRPVVVLGPAVPESTKSVAEALESHRTLLAPFSFTLFATEGKGHVISASPSMSAVIEAKVSFISRFSWSRVGILYDYRRVDGFFTLFKDYLLTSLRNHGITTTGEVGIDPSNPDLQSAKTFIREKLISLMVENTKIFLAEVDSFGALVLFCEIYKLNLHQANNVWLLNPLAGSVDDWLTWYNSTEHGQLVSCPSEAIRTAANGAFVFDKQIIRRDNIRTVSGLYATDYPAKLVQMAKAGEGTSASKLQTSAYGFDAFWAIVTALDQLHQRGVNLDTTTANMTILTSNIIQQLNNVSFQGLTGPVSFTDNQRNGIIAIKQFQEGGRKLVNVGIHMSENLEFFNNTNLLWANGMAPLDKPAKIRLVIGCLVYQMDNKEYKDKFGFVRSLNLVRELIYNRTEFKTLTDNYDIQLMFLETYKRASLSIFGAYRSMQNKPRAIAVLGPALAEMTEPTADALDVFETLLVPFSSRIYVSHKSNVMESSPDMNGVIEAKVAFMKHFNWKRTAILYNFRGHGGFFTAFVDELTRQLRNNSIEISGTFGIDPTSIDVDASRKFIKNKLTVLKEDDTKIYMVEMDAYGALVLFCQVYHLKLHGPDVVWLLHPLVNTMELWWRYNDTKNGQIVPCTKEQIKEAAKGAFIFERVLMRNDGVRTDAGMTKDEYINKIISMQTPGDINNLQDLMTSGYSFDAFWGLSIALNNSAAAMKQKNLTLDTNQVRQASDMRKITNELKTQLNKVKFEGLTGPVKYYDYKRQGVFVIKQVKENENYERVGTHMTSNNRLFFSNESNLWPNNEIPKDRSRIIFTTLVIKQPIMIAVASATAVGILLGLLFLTFNFVYRKYKFIKLSAPLFNNIIAFGCILCLASVYLFGIHDAAADDFSIVCKARAWTLSIGFSCAFGAMFIKTWRIYKICTNKKLKVKLGPLSDWYLLSLVASIIIVDLVILITWEVVDPLHHKVYNFAKEKDAKKPFTLNINQLNICTADMMIVWLTVMYVYKGVLLLYGVFLAYETRNVIYAHLNDSRVIGICVYNVVVLSVVGAFLSIILQHDNYEVMFMVLSVCIIFPATATICLLLFPKVSYRCKTNNLDDADTTLNGGTTGAGRTMDLSSTCYPTEVHHREKSTDPPPAQNVPSVVLSYQNGTSNRSTGSPSPTNEPEGPRAQPALPTPKDENHLSVENIAN